MASSQQQSNQGSQFTGLSSGDQNAVRALIQTLLGGGTQDYQAMRAKRNADKVSLQQLTQDYTNDAAFSDAGSLMALNLQDAMEKQMPAIAKAVQGAGTSSSSMQALMSNKIAQDAALHSGALGAEQAKAYAGAQANMQGTIEQYTRGGDDTAKSLIDALSLLKTSTEQHSGQSSGSSSDPASSSGSSGGGSRSSGGGTSSGGSTGGWSNSGYASGTGGGTFVDSSGGGSYGGDVSNSDPFYYDDWGTGSTSLGDMSSGSSVGSSLDSGDYMDYSIAQGAAEVDYTYDPNAYDYTYDENNW